MHGQDPPTPQDSVFGRTLNEGHPEATRPLQSSFTSTTGALLRSMWLRSWRHRVWRPGGNGWPTERGPLLVLDSLSVTTVKISGEDPEISGQVALHSVFSLNEESFDGVGSGDGPSD